MTARSACEPCTAAATRVRHRAIHRALVGCLRCLTCRRGHLWGASSGTSCRCCSMPCQVCQPGPLALPPPSCSRGRHCAHGGGGPVPHRARAALCRRCGGAWRHCQPPALAPFPLCRQLSYAEEKRGAILELCRRCLGGVRSFNVCAQSRKIKHVTPFGSPACPCRASSHTE